jgi:hypothetical protein
MQIPPAQWFTRAFRDKQRNKAPVKNDRKQQSQVSDIIALYALELSRNVR